MKKPTLMTFVFGKEEILSKQFSKEIIAALKEEKFLVIKNPSYDEIDQAGQQNKKLVYIFLGPHLNLNVIKTLHGKDIESMNILYLPNYPQNLGEEMQEKISSYKLTLYPADLKNQLMSEIKKFYDINKEDNKEINTSDDIELDFTVFDELD